METSLLLKALGDSTRYKIFNCLLERKHCVRSLSKKLGITESAISQHLKLMKEAGLVYGEKYGYHMHYLPSHDALDVLVNYFMQMKEKSDSLDCDMTKCQCEYREVSNEKVD